MQPFPHNRLARFLAAVLTVFGVGGMLVGMYPGTYRYTAGRMLLVILVLHVGIVVFFFRRRLGWDALLVAVAFSLVYFGIVALARSYVKIGG